MLKMQFKENKWLHCFFQFIPMPVLYGVFLYMGVSSLRGIQVQTFFTACSMSAPWYFLCVEAGKKQWHGKNCFESKP